MPDNFDKIAMRWMWLVIAICLLKVCTACTPETKAAGPLDMSCTSVGWTYRCENAEAVCYVYASYGVSCIKKDIK